MPNDISADQALKAFEERLKSSIKWFQSVKPRSVILIHHNDTDGLSAGTICLRAFERAGLKLSRYCLEKPYPEALTRIFAGANSQDLVVLTDLASGMVSRIESINMRALPVLVLDHHRADKFSAPWLFLLNSTQCGLDGTTHGSASAVAFRFVLALSDLNRDLKPLALLGAYGDGQFRSEHDLQGLNALHLIDPLEIDGYSFEQLKQGLNILGSYAYFRAGPDIAIKLLSEKINPLSWSVVTNEQEKFESERQKFLSNCTIETNSNLSSFKLDAFLGAGVKMVGLMCEQLLEAELVGPMQYLLGYQTLTDQIPGLGPVGISGLKVSMRVGEERWQFIERGKSPDVAQILAEAATKVGGLVDGCHRHAGAVTILSSEKARFQKLVQEIVG